MTRSTSRLKDRGQSTRHPVIVRFMGLLFPTFTALCGLLASSTLEAHEPDRLIRAGRVETMSGEALVPGEVLISKGKIKEVGVSIDAPDEAERIDLGPRSVLIPGLIDSNAPVDFLGARSEYTRELTPDFSVLPAIDWNGPALVKQLSSGTTTAVVLPGTDNVIGGLACVIKTWGPSQDRLVNPELALVVTVGSDPSDRNLSRVRPDSIYVRSPTNRMGVVNLLRATFAATKDPKLEFGPALDGQAKVPLSRIRDALSGNRILLGQSRTSFDIRTLLGLAEEFGFHPVLVGGEEAYKVLGLLAERRISVILSPINVAGLRGPEGTELCWNLPGLLAESKVGFAFSGGDLLDQARFARRYGLSPYESLKAITINPATILGLSNRLGSIEPGKVADFVAFEDDPLEFTTPIRWVMVAGAIRPISSRPTSEGNTR